ncbi:MAG TPA: glucose 1-dehydrogenase [Bryobacteraceae bacterium]|nr:glucose 1-dehydrogenase [Bryobacteraceae bacterium]
MNSQFDGKVALVTGGSSGIGLATAKLFAQRGAKVYITGRRHKELEEAVREIGKSATGIQGDVSLSADIDKVYQTIRKEKGKLDILFANAGVGEFAPLGQINEEHFDKQFDINVKGTLFTVQGALALMPAGSAIVLNASLVSIKGSPAFSVYSATKAALRSFVRNWAVDLRSKGIRVNAVSPGVVPTPGYHTSLGMTEQQLDDYIRSVTPAIPLGRTGTTDEIAKAVAFLASDESSYITGSELFVDGGQGQI